MIPALDWLHAGPVAAAAFLASAVEAVEAATIVLAAGVTRGWRSALGGAAAALAALAALVLAFGAALAAVPIAALQLAVGSLLLLFGMRWLRKAILRQAGVIDRRDEVQIYARERRALAGQGSTAPWDPAALLASFKAVLLEGIEVIVIVIGVGAGGGRLLPASAGAVAACVAVSLVALALHRPLTRVPENALKLTVGVMVSSFGLFWFGEGIGVDWLLGDATILVLIAVLLAAAFCGVWLARKAAR